MPTTEAIEFTKTAPDTWGIDKTVGARKDYGVDASLRLVDGDSIDPATVRAIGTGVIVDGDAFLDNGTFVMAWVKGGDINAGSDNHVDFSWSTVGGRIETQRIFFRIKP